MPRKPNYDFERREREKARTAKKEARDKAKAERKTDSDVPEAGGAVSPNDGDAANPAASPPSTSSTDVP